ncbi:MAG: MarR family transcriptional regulator [Alphaproteobacteria bacterium]
MSDKKPAPKSKQGQHDKAANLFGLMNEIGIINQLGTNLFAKRMPAPLTMPQFSVLNHLLRIGDGTTPKQIASAFQVPNTSMSHTLALLHRNGFITYQQNDQDKRSKTVWITDQGRAIQGQAIMALENDFAQLSTIVEGDDIDALVNALTRIRQFMDDHRLED